MSWQTLFISKPSRLSIKHQNIMLNREDQDDVYIAISEISIIVIEHLQVSMTAIFMATCAENNIAVIFIDKKYTPVGLFIPFCQHSRTSKNALVQKNWPQPFKSRLWQKIIVAKITNQFHTILKIHQYENRQLKYLITSVQSGDKTNRESYAASLYWRALFGNFKRHTEKNWHNAALDYGYSIIRSAIARSITASGLVPSFGIFHRSELNAFNLADDLIEPFRPFVDYQVYQLSIFTLKEKLAQQDRIELVNLLHKKIRINDQETTILHAIQQSVFSLLKAGEKKDVKCLQLPQYL